MKDNWNLWHKKELISDKKYNRLTRKDKFTDSELSDFIARQIVQTSQASISAARLFERIYEKTRTVYVKAENVSDFRHDNKDYDGFVKVRSVNDHHHAKDAYLNIVVGNVYDEKFTSNPKNFIKNQASISKDDKDRKENYNLKYVMTYDLKRNGKFIWNNNMRNTVRKMMKSNDVRVTRKHKEQKGALFNATIIKGHLTKPNIYLPLKNSDERLHDMKKYGGYGSIKTAYYVFVEYTYLKKSKTKESVVKESRFISIPTYISINSKIDAVKEYIKNYIINEIGKKDTLNEFNIISDKILINSVVELDGNKYYLLGKTDDSAWVSKVPQLVLNNDYIKIIKKIDKFIDSEYKFTDLLTDEELNLIYDELVYKLGTNIYKDVFSNKYKDLSSEETVKKFRELDLKNKADIINELLGFMTDRKNLYNLKTIGVSISQGRASLKMAKINIVKLINQSITGIFENVEILKG